MKPLHSEKLGKLCKRCFKNPAADKICASCKNELIAIYENKLTWRTAFEIERISKKAMRYSATSDSEDELY
jgi:hypothetical protein